MQIFCSILVLMVQKKNTDILFEVENIETEYKILIKVVNIILKIYQKYL